jgi:hypothetical protein
MATERFAARLAGQCESISLEGETDYHCEKYQHNKRTKKKKQNIETKSKSEVKNKEMN